MDYIDMHIIKIIKDILFNIDKYNINILTLCDNLYINSDDFINLLNNPVRNISLYLGILEEVKNEGV